MRADASKVSEKRDVQTRHEPSALEGKLAYYAPQYMLHQAASLGLGLMSLIILLRHCETVARSFRTMSKD
jgi:hypothetical protein